MNAYHNLVSTMAHALMEAMDLNATAYQDIQVLCVSGIFQFATQQIQNVASMVVLALRDQEISFGAFVLQDGVECFAKNRWTHAYFYNLVYMVVSALQEILISFVLALLVSFSGLRCEHELTLCTQNPCLNGAICVEEDNESICYCVPDYHGDLCQFQYDECLLPPTPSCKNGGTCIDGIDGFSCSCPPDVTGKFYMFDGISPQEITTGLSVDELEFTHTSKPFLRTTSLYQDESTSDSDLKFPSTKFGDTSVSGIPSTVIQDSVTDEAVSYSTAIDLETSDMSSSGSFGTTELAQIDSTFSVPTISTEQESHQGTVLHSSTSKETFNATFTHKFHSSPYTSTPSDPTGLPQDTSSRQFTVPLTTIAPEGKGTDVYPTDSDSSKRCDDKSSPCLNGGTCVAYGDDFQCRCPLQFDGVNCERPSNVTEVSLLPASWLLFRVVTPADETSTGSELSFSHRLEATLRIVSEEGVIFTLAEAEEGSLVPSYHMQMSLLRGRLRLQFSCGLQSVRFSESKQRIDTGHPTKISASLTVWAGTESSVHMGRCRAELRLNNSLAVSGEQLRPLGAPRRHAAIAHLVFGAWPRGRHAARPPHALLVSEEEEDVGVGPAAPGVTACLSGIKVNGWTRLLLADITAGTSDVTECVQLACLSNPCLHGGTCEESASATWSCRCPTGRLGARCEKSVCTNSPCEGGELLVSQPCLAPALVGVSPHLALPLTPRHSSFRHGLELSLRFTAARTHQVALLAYLGHGPRDHMALSYVHGRIMLTWDLGSGPRRVFTAKEFVAGVEREVEVGRAGREAWLRVLGDNGTHSGHSTGKMTQLNTRPVLLIGGFDRGNSSLLPHDLPKHSGFEGCVSNIEIKTGSSVTRYFPPGPPASPLQGRAVSQHSVQACASNPCLHRGICLPHGPSFTCLCAQGWFGPICAEPSNPCDSKTSLCAEGSTCVPLLRGYECDCPLGKTGPFCRTVETRGTVVWPEIYFSGKRSYLEIPRNSPGSSDPGIPEHSCVEFEMKLSPASSGVSVSAAQVLFFSRDADTHDYMALILTSERDMQLLLGTGDGSPMQLRSPRGSVVRPGVWVRVRAGRVGRRVFLSVGGRPVSSWLLPGQAGDWSGGAAPLFIGGVPDLATVAPLVWSPIKPFSGCIRRLHVDWRKVLVHIGRAKVSPRGSQPFTSQAFQEPVVAQLTPEYLRQVQLSESWSSSNFGDDLTSFFQHESLAAFVSGQRENIQNWNPKDYNVVNQLKRKADPGFKSNHAQSKVTSLSLVTLTPQYNVTNRLEKLLTSEMQNKLTTVTTPVAPTVLSRSLRSRDALFASTARNIRPCDKSSPAMVQLEPCSKDQVETIEGCQSLQYQVQQSSTSLTYPGFHGNGWLLIKLPTQFLKSSDIEWQSSAPFSFLRIRFSSTQPNDIILWAQQEETNGAFVGVGLKDGRLNVVWGNSDRGKPHFTTTLLSSSLADGILHSVSVLWDCSGEAKEAHVWVDGERGEVEQEHERTRRKRQQHHTSPPSLQESAPLTIYLGGFPESRLVHEASLGHFKSPLTGCIAELSWDDESAMLSEFTSYPHSNVTPCK
ncbi:hypothetical protein B566_EDAN006872 [Ephemera danica]|nr:hypothetical protein B566_EDAN006872 [Ephemera danica]